MKRRVLLLSLVGALWIAAPTGAHADVPRLTTGSDDAVCVSVQPLAGACQGSPDKAVRELLRYVPD